MPDYKEMYLTMVRDTEKAIKLLIHAQQVCEEMYINGEQSKKEPVEKTAAKSEAPPEKNVEFTT